MEAKENGADPNLVLNSEFENPGTEPLLPKSGLGNATDLLSNLGKSSPDFTSVTTFFSKSEGDELGKASVAVLFALSHSTTSLNFSYK